MATWRQFVTAEPEMAREVAAAFAVRKHCTLATVRADGAPRISGTEVTFTEDDVLLGMMPDSRKCLDVRRDPRVVLLTPVADKRDLDGEGKLFGRLVEISGTPGAEEFLAASAEAAGMDPAALAGSPTFQLDVEAAAWQFVVDDTFRTRSWDPERGVRERGRIGASGQVVDLA